MYLGMIFSVFIGKNNLGIFSLISAPSSLISKNCESFSAPSFDAPIEPIADISNVSAPLKTFLVNKEMLPEKPTV